MRRPEFAAPLIAFILCALVAPPARGDAIPPPDRECPSGQVAITDHGGTRCELEAPKNCPPGWIGQVGGTCALHQCADDSSCGDPSKVCRDFSLCFEPREVRPFCVDYPSGANEGSPRSPLLGMEPPPACSEIDSAPRTEWFAVNVCGDAERCASPSECRPGKLCVPKSAPAPRVMPRKSDGAVNDDPPGGRVPPRAGGCGSGCAGAPSGASGGLGAFLAVLGLVALGRRRREPG